ncbi:uncharacterized protein LOC108606331 [Drosophila busckii]|nr:uncharacterized protein LOC108606331 [Drosophila busckii]XP_017851845.1 uncharacterized protein LOC108606331 [Drosophila busckii]
MPQLKVLKDDQAPLQQQQLLPSAFAPQCETQLEKDIKDLDTILQILLKQPYSMSMDEQLIDEQDTEQQQQQMLDEKSTLHGRKVLNVLLKRLWRRRRAEALILNCLLKKYKEKSRYLLDNLYLHNRWIWRQQQRADRLALKLSKAQIVATQAKLFNETMERQRRKELDALTQDLNNNAEALLLSRREMFREFAKFRELAKQLADLQRENTCNEIYIEELKEQLLLAERSFPAEHIEQLLHDIREIKQLAYRVIIEQAKNYDQSIYELELKYTQLLEKHQRSQLSIIKRKLNALGNLLCCLFGGRFLRIQWPDFRFLLCKLVGSFLNYMCGNSVKIKTLIVSLPLALVLIGSIYFEGKL